MQYMHIFYNLYITLLDTADIPKKCVIMADYFRI